jgi:hypothetical protein
MCGKNKQYFFILPVGLLLSCVVGVLRGEELPQPGKTQQSSPGNNSSSSSSSVHFQTWETLSGKFDRALETHEATLNEALQRLQTSELNGSKLNDLLNQSLRQNGDLKNYNNQIGQRMQESDEWNSELQDDNVKLKAGVKAEKAQGLRNTIIAGIVGIVLGLLIPFIIKLLRMFKVIPI